MINTKQSQLDKHILELLPWYVNKTLSMQERSEVEAYLATHPETQDDVELLQKMQQTAEEDIIVPAANTDRLMQKLDANERIENTSFNQTFQQFRDWLLSPKLAWAAVPAVFALAIISFVWLPGQTGNHNFQTLSSGEEHTALNITVTTSVKNSSGILVSELKKIAPTVSISAESDHRIIIVLPGDTNVEQSLELLQILRSKPYVTSAELVTTP